MAKDRARGKLPPPDASKPKESEQAPAPFQGRGGKAAPAAMQLPTPGDPSRMSKGAQAALGKTGYDWRAEKDDDDDEEMAMCRARVDSGPAPGSPEARAERLKRMGNTASAKRILQEDDQGNLKDQDDQPPPWAGWAAMASKKGDRAPDDWRGWGSQTPQDVREIAMKGAKGVGMDVLRTTQTIHI